LEAADIQGNAWNVVQIGTLPPTPHVNSQGYAVGQIILGGKPQIILSSGSGIYYFEVPPNPGAGNWPRTQITSGASEEGVAVGDIDRDGSLDVVASGLDNVSIYWWKNPGNGTSNWVGYKIGTTVQRADRVAVADINGDGRLDIVVTEETPLSGASVYWFEQPADPTSPNWPRHTLVTQYTTNSLDVADMNRDGSIDIITGEHRGTQKLSIWENVNHGASFTEHVVDTGKESHLGARVADLDGGGDLDIVSIAWDTYQYLHLWRNDARALIGVVTPPAITTQPANQTVTAGQTATFIAAATGSPAPTVQWQVSTDGGATFSIILGATSTTLSFTTALSQNGNQYRAVFTNSAGTATTTAATLTVNPAPSSTWRDDFTSSTLDPSWSFADPVANSSFSLTANPGHLQVSVPAGSGHDCWNTALNCARLLRSVSNTDASYETKIDGVNIGAKFQTYGIFLQQDNANFLRFEFWTNGSGVRPAAWRNIGGIGSTAIYGPVITLGSSNYLRVTRTGSTFQLNYSTNGTTWVTAGSFTQAGFSVKKAGLHVDNARGTSSPVTTGNFDYFQIQ
jgi:hypothetical protein